MMSGRRAHVPVVAVLALTAAFVCVGFATSALGPSSVFTTHPAGKTTFDERDDALSLGGHHEHELELRRRRRRHRRLAEEAQVASPIVLSDRKGRTLRQLDLAYSNRTHFRHIGGCPPDADEEDDDGGDDDDDDGINRTSGSGGRHLRPPWHCVYYGYPYHHNPAPHPPPTIGYGSSLWYPLVVGGVSAPKCLINHPPTCTCYGPFSIHRPWVSGMFGNTPLSIRSSHVPRDKGSSLSYLYLLQLLS